MFDEAECGKNVMVLFQHFAIVLLGIQFLYVFVVLSVILSVSVWYHMVG